MEDHRDDPTQREREARQERENTATTAQLRREIEEYNDLDSSKERAIRQIDALEKRGIHRVEKYEGQSAHFAVGDAYMREVNKDREREKEADAQQAGFEHQGNPNTDLDRGRHQRAEPSTADWAEGYEVTQDAKTGAVAYAREGERKIYDDGRNVTVANDPQSLRDAVTLVKEQGSDKIVIRGDDPAKRQAIMKECIRQDVKIEMPSKEVEAEVTKAFVAVAREKAIASLQAQQSTAQSNDGPELGD